MLKITTSSVSTMNNVLRIIKHEVFYVFKPNGRVILTLREQPGNNWTVGTMSLAQFTEMRLDGGTPGPYSFDYFIRGYRWNNINDAGESTPTHDELLRVM